MYQQIERLPEVRDFMAGTTPIWIKDLAAAVGWLGFLVLGCLVVWAELRGRTRWRRNATHLLLLYTVGLAGAVGLTRRELWPFSAWSMIPNVRDPVAGMTRVFGVDSAGREYPIDVRAWHPLQWAEVTSWLTLRFPRLSRDAQVEVMQYMLQKANAARERATRGESPGYLDRYLGPLVAPEHLLHVRAWSRPDAVPPAPFRGLTVVREWWNVEVGRTRPDQITRDTLFAPLPSEPAP